MDSSNSGYASRSPQPVSVPSPKQTGDHIVIPSVRRHAFRRLQTRQQFLPLLIATTVLTLLVVIAIGYVAARANAISAAQASASTNAQIAREVISERGQYPSLVNNQLVASSGANTYALVNDTWVVDHVRQLTGNWAVIYQLTNAPSLLAVSTNLPKTDIQGQPIANTRAIGQLAPAAAQSAIIGTCGATNSTTACYGDYTNVVTIGDVSYVAGIEPLLDQNGHLVGAVGVFMPLDDVLAAPKQLAILLLMMGLLVGLIVLVAGTWLAGQFPNRLLRQLDGQLDTMARAAVELGRLAHQQQFRLQHQQRAARQVGDHALKLESLAETMDDGQAALHQTTTAIWEEMSAPGVAINAATALRLAREAAIRASEVGTAGDATRAHARQVVTLMNQVIAEGRALAQEGQAAEMHANELALTLDQMETDLGEQLAPRRYDLGSAPLVRRITAVSHRLLQMLQSGESAPSTQRQQTPARPSTRAGGSPDEARGSPSGPARRGDFGWFPAARMDGNEPFNPFPNASQSGFPPSYQPGVSGSRRGGRYQGGDASSPPGGLPPLGRFDDDFPPREPNDSNWLNE